MVSLPTFGWVLAGALVARMGWLSQSLNDRISRLSFNFGLPLMLFTGAAGVDYRNASSTSFLMAGVVATLLVMIASGLYSRWRRHPRREQGIFVQGAFRSNLAIMGVALHFGLRRNRCATGGPCGCGDDHALQCARCFRAQSNSGSELLDVGNADRSAP